MIDEVKYEPVKEQGTLPQIKAITQKYINTILEVIIFLIVFSLMVSYFFTFKLNSNLTWKDYTINALMVCVGTFSVGMLCRQIATNKARLTPEYEKAKADTKTKIAELRTSGYGQYVEKYCLWYSEQLKKDMQTHIVESVGLTYEIYSTKYAYKKDKSYTDLNDAQIKAIKQADKVPLKKYNSNFLLTVDVSDNANTTPSSIYAPNRRRVIDTISSALWGTISSMFVCTIGLELFAHLSVQAVIIAIVKLIFLGITASLKLTLGWRIVMEQEIPNYELKQSEIENCIQWSKKQ